jgi:hypothetical protein
MNLLPSEEGFIQRIVSTLFPPKLPKIKDLSASAEYHQRLQRTGVEHKPGLAFGRVFEPAREKRVIALPGRVV